MPYIQVRLANKLDDSQKDELQKKLTELVSAGLSKPKAYIMAEIEDGCSLYMNEARTPNGAYISIGLLGSVDKSTCSNLTGQICEILKTDYDTEPSQTYITYHPCNLWGWNGMMF